MESPDIKKAILGFLPQFAFYDTLQNCCLSKQLTHCVSQDVSIFKIEVVPGEQSISSCRELKLSSFQVALGALLISRASVICLFLFFLPRLALGGDITAFQCSGWQDHCVVMGCVCVGNHGYYHFSDHFFLLHCCSHTFGVTFFGFQFWTGAFEIEIFSDTQFSTISCPSDFVKRG